MISTTFGVKDRLAEVLKRKKLVALAVIAVALSRLPIGCVTAAAGDVDQTFGRVGEVILDSVPLFTEAHAIAVLPDNRIVVSGGAFGVARYSPDGTLDSSFGSGGTVTNSGLGYASALAVQNDGKLVVAGTDPLPFSFVAARYNPDGTTDTNFGSGGASITRFPSSDFAEATAVAVQPDGRIVVAGTVNSTIALNQQFGLLRYNPNGVLDPNFGSGGVVLTSFFGQGDFITAVAIQPDGKIVAVGAAFLVNKGQSMALARYNPDGSLDTSFGTGGKVTDDLSGRTGIASAVALQPDGKIIVGGVASAEFPPFNDFALLRYDTGGQLDASFGSGGRVFTDFSDSDDHVRALAIQDDGRILAAGFTDAARPGFDFALARYNSDGTLNKSFGKGGRVITNLSGDASQAFAVANQNGGKVIAAGVVFTDPSINKSGVALVRYDLGIPKVTDASVQGKELLVTGTDFDEGAAVLLNGEEQRTSNDEQNPSTNLIARKAGKRIKPGDRVMLQVRNADGSMSAAFEFIRPSL